MTNLGPILKQLRSERDRAKHELERVDRAIAALGKLTGNGHWAGNSRVRRKLSAAARKRIADAQRARWAKVRKQKAAA